MPYPNEHACRLRDPDDFQEDSFRRESREHEGKRYDAIMGKLKGESTMTDQAYRYPKDIWTEAEARQHCKDHDGILFEPASEGGSAGELFGEECCGEQTHGQTRRPAPTKGYQMTRSYILNAFIENPWAILPHKLAILEEIVARHVAGEKLDAEEVQMRIHGAKQPSERRINNVAVLPLSGTIFPRANLITEKSGGTSVERFGNRFTELIDDPKVDAIVLDVDSPGGNVLGIDEAAKKIYEARGQKPIVAVANHLMASAAYWIGTAADEVVVTPSGEVGSIGVFSVHEDISQALEMEGVKLTLISEGKYKVEGNPYEPLGAEAQAAIQGRVSDYYDAFIKAVARNREVKPAAVRNGFGEGRVVGARQAIDLGMADRIGTLEETINRLLNSAPAGDAASQAELLSEEVEHILTKEQLEEAEDLRERIRSIFETQRETEMRRQEIESVVQLVNALRQFKSLSVLERENEMQDLKPYFDAVNAADAEVQRIAHDLDELFRDGTEESKAKALEMKPTLDAAIAKHTEAVALYESMQKANRPNDVAKNFVPVSTTQPDQAENSQPAVIKRADYDRLSLVDRAKFIRSGGSVED